MVCNSTVGEAYFISAENFIDCVNSFKFSDKILQEQILRHQHYLLRVKETKNFQETFEKQSKMEVGKVEASETFDRVAREEKSRCTETSPKVDRFIELLR